MNSVQAQQARSAAIVRGLVAGAESEIERFRAELRASIDAGRVHPIFGSPFVEREELFEAWLAVQERRDRQGMFASLLAERLEEMKQTMPETISLVAELRNRSMRPGAADRDDFAMLRARLRTSCGNDQDDPQIVARRKVQTIMLRLRSAVEMPAHQAKQVRLILQQEIDRLAS